ncbi:hypothetical protein [Streptomyces sp. NPDC006997]
MTDEVPLPAARDLSEAHGRTPALRGVSAATTALPLVRRSVRPGELR